MEKIWSSDVDAILGVGRSLEHIGVRNWALELDPALTALDQLSAIGVAVLGGDVYDVTEGSAEPSYDNWYCNREVGESQPEFVARSIAKAKSYINSYRASPGSVIFAIVPSV